MSLMYKAKHTAIRKLTLSLTHLNSMLSLYRNQSIDLLWKAIDLFIIYDGNISLTESVLLAIVNKL